jgi:hypothetical protein
MSHRPNQLENYAIQEQYNPRTGHFLSDTKDILILFLRDLFYQMPPGEGCFHFEPGDVLDGSGSLNPAMPTDEEETELIISDAGSVNTSSVESRPAIIISRGPFAWGNTSLDQMLSRTSSVDSATQRTHTDMLTGSFVVNCVSSKGLEAETIALIVFKAIRIYRRELQKAGFFHIGTLVQVGSETPAGSFVSGESEEDFINVPVSFPIYYQESWTVEKAAQVLNSICAKVQYVAKHFSGDLLVPGSVDENGDPVEGSEGVIVQAWTVTVTP